MTGIVEPGALFGVGDIHAGVLGGVTFDPGAVVRSLRPGVDAEQVRVALGRFTPQQLNVIHHVVNSARNVMVVATAGSGKSTVLRTVAQVLPGGLDVGAFALNRSIAQELRGALPRDVQVSTFHAFGRRLVEEHCPVQATFTEWKRLNIVKSVLKEAGVYSRGVAKSLMTLVRLSMVHIANSSEAVMALAAEQEFEFPDSLDVVGAVRAVQDRALANFRERGHFDDDDMLYLPLKLGYGFESLDVALVDEAQDFSRLQHRLVRHVVGRRGRVVFVGDDSQAIYGFSGADRGGLDRAAQVFDAVTLPLTVTFRCPASHVELASAFSDGIEAAPGAADGEVRRVTEEDLLGELRPGDLVMCRRNAPMLSLAMRAAQEGLPVEVLGHDIVKAMEGHVRRCFAYSFAPDEVEGRLHEYGMSLLQAHYESGLRGKVLRRAVEADVDLLSCVASFAAEVALLAERRGARASGEDVMTLVRSLFVTKGPAVRMCTVHKAKGLEARRVALLEADEVIDAGRAGEGEGDAAVAFVALTRGKELLWLVHGSQAGVTLPDEDE